MTSSNNSKTNVSAITGKENRSFEIIFFSLSILVLAVMLVSGYSYVNNKKAIESLSEELIDEINQLVFQESKNYLMTAVDMTELSSRISSEGLETLDNNPRLDSLMINILSLHGQLLNFEIGNEEGNFLMQRREKNGTISTKLIKRTGDNVQVKWKYRDQEGKISETEDPKDKYDPRTRPWYQGAKAAGELFWTDVYVFATDKSPGLTASSPVYNKDKKLVGIFGLDIPLRTISEFLKKLKEDLKEKSIGESSIIFIVNDKGEVIAYPDPEVPMIMSATENKLVPRKMDQLENAEHVIASYKQHLQDKDKSKFNIDVNGVRYIASYRRFKKEEFNKDWTIGLIVPEDDLIGPIKKTNNLLIGISIAILLGAMVLGVILLQIKKSLDMKSRFIKETFGKYLSDEIVSTILESPAGMQLGGDKRVATIMMTDLRGFTSIGERLPAESVVNMINIYLDVMTEIIMKYNGTIDEFIGDAILVIFGAPIQRPDDAQRAVACALEMQIAMAEVNRRNLEAGYPEVAMGIGINTGDIVVGNIGSSRRMKYGVVGKNVNLTSRIESYTTGGQTYISPATVEACNGLLRIDDQMDVTPKGVNNTITISLVGGIGGSFNVYLPEKKDLSLTSLKETLEMEFTILAGKHASNDLYIGKIDEFGMEETIVNADIEVEKLDNLKITSLRIKGQFYKTDLYAKVIKVIGKSPSQFRINFTSTPPESGEIMQKILKEFSK
jgi:adenylate cyclase